MAATNRPDFEAHDLRGLRAGIGTDTAMGAVVPPLYLSTNYAFAGLGQSGAYDYGRGGNPTRDLLADALNSLEGGAGAVVTSSGLAALNLVFLALAKPGSTVIAPHDLYGGTWRLLNELAARGIVDREYADLTDLTNVERVIAEHEDGSPISLMLIETPSNPLLRITDIRETARRFHEIGALVVVDNTFCSPLLQQPLTLGADVVVHSSTKFLNGHSDVISGVAIGGTPEIAERLVYFANVYGLTGSPVDAWLTLRGLRTLEARVRLHQANAAAIVTELQTSSAVAAVHYPGLPDHPGHELAAVQQSGFGSLISFELAGGSEAAARFVDGLQVFNLAESLGGVESLVAHPATMTHAAMTDHARADAGVSDGLLRLSVGIEPANDLITDLRAALSRAAS